MFRLPSFVLRGNSRLLCACSNYMAAFKDFARGDGDLPPPAADMVLPGVDVDDVIWSSGSSQQHHDVHQRWFNNLPSADAAPSDLCHEAARDLWSFMNHGALKVPLLCTSTRVCVGVCVSGLSARWRVPAWLHWCAQVCVPYIQSLALVLLVVIGFSFQTFTDCVWCAGDWLPVWTGPPPDQV